jgi:RHS repeat-associated protein
MDSQDGYNNGNMTQMPQLTMSYDVANRMVSSNHASAGTQSYGYNHANQRVFVRNGNTVTYYLYGLGGERLMEFEETCTGGACGGYTETQRWIYFAGRKMFSKTGSTLKAVTPNRLASEAKHFPYGETDGTPPADTKDYFATYRRDGTGLDYAWNRYYSPTMGRFTTADLYGGSVRLSNPGTWNRYAYANSNPVLNRDPSGLDVEDPCGSSPYVCDVFSSGPLLGTINIWDLIGGGTPSADLELAAANAQTSDRLRRHSQGISVALETMRALVSEASLMARALIANTECTALIAPTGMSTGKLLDLFDLYRSEGISHNVIERKSISFVNSSVRASMPTNAATTSAVTRTHEIAGVTYWTEVKIVTAYNNDSAGAFVSPEGEPDYNALRASGYSPTGAAFMSRALTVIHEFGHAINAIYGRVVNSIVDDDPSIDRSLSPWNSAKVLESCAGGAPW